MFRVSSKRNLFLYFKTVIKTRKNEDFLKEQIVESVVESTPIEMLINQDNLNTVSAWICDSIKTNQIKLNLLFKATFDGFSAMDFKKKCANIKNTVEAVILI